MKNSNFSWHQKILLWWVQLSLLDKILCYLFCASFFVIVIPSILNDFFYASIYFTDFSISFSIILLFFCVFWLGYFSGHTENGESKKIEWLENLETSEKSKKSRKLGRGAKFKKWLNKNRISALSQGLKSKLLYIKCLPSGLYGILVTHLQRRISPKLILSMGIYYHSQKNIKVDRGDVNFYTKIKDMPPSLPLHPIGKKKVRSYSLIVKKIKDEESKPRQKLPKPRQLETVAEKKGKWH